jgi:hypothetical protein
VPPLPSLHDRSKAPPGSILNAQQQIHEPRSTPYGIRESHVDPPSGVAVKGAAS